MNIRGVNKNKNRQFLVTITDRGTILIPASGGCHVPLVFGQGQERQQPPLSSTPHNALPC